MQLPLGWWTDLEVARRSGAQIRQSDGYYVVRTRANPGYHWGNFVLVPGTESPDAARALFRREFPEARHVAIGLLSRPDVTAWAPVPVEVNEVRATRTPPAVAAVPGYEIRELTGEDWRQSWRNETTGMPPDYADFAWRRIEARQALMAAGEGVFAGAFRGDELVSDLGIVVCGSVARYQSVFTRAEHRGQGLASWLLARAGAWAQRRGADQWVILSDPGGDAARLYERLGFGVVDRSYQIEVGPGA